MSSSKFLLDSGFHSFRKERNGAADLTRLGSAPHYWQLTRVNSFWRVRRVPLVKCSIWVRGPVLVGQSSFHWPRYIVGAVDLFDYYVAVQVSATLLTSIADHTKMHSFFLFVYFYVTWSMHVLLHKGNGMSFKSSSRVLFYISFHF